MNQANQAEMRQVAPQQSSAKLAAKDFITIGIFSAISFAMMMVAAVANVTPWTYLFYGALFAFLNGPVYLIVAAKVPKRSAILLFHVVPFFYLAVSGVFGIMNAALVVVFAIVAEVMLRWERHSFKRLALTYVVLMLWESVGSLFFMFVTPDWYVQQMAGLGVDAVYVETIGAIAHQPLWWVLVIAVTALTSFLGVLLGRGILKKHLQKAGIV